MNTSRIYRLRRAGAVVAIAAFALFLHSTTGANAESNPELHTVQPGDTLWEISTKNYSSSEDPRSKVEEIRLANDLNGYNIHPGQTLRLPG